MPALLPDVPFALWPCFQRSSKSSSSSVSPPGGLFLMRCAKHHQVSTEHHPEQNLQQSAVIDQRRCAGAIVLHILPKHLISIRDLTLEIVITLFSSASFMITANRQVMRPLGLGVVLTQKTCSTNQIDSGYRGYCAAELYAFSSMLIPGLHAVLGRRPGLGK